MAPLVGTTWTRDSESRRNSGSRISKVGALKIIQVDERGTRKRNAVEIGGRGRACDRRVLPKSVYFGPRPSATLGARFLAKSVLYINGTLTAQDAWPLDYFWDQLLSWKYRLRVIHRWRPPARRTAALHEPKNRKLMIFVEPSDRQESTNTHVLRLCIRRPDRDSTMSLNELRAVTSRNDCNHERENCRRNYCFSSRDK